MRPPAWVILACLIGVLLLGGAAFSNNPDIGFLYVLLAVFFWALVAFLYGMLEAESGKVWDLEFVVEKRDAEIERLKFQHKNDLTKKDMEINELIDIFQVSQGKLVDRIAELDHSLGEGLMTRALIHTADRRTLNENERKEIGKNIVVAELKALPKGVKRREILS